MPATNRDLATAGRKRDAELVFSIAAIEALRARPEARVGLSLCHSPAARAEWATRWRVDAPCVLAYIEQYVAAGIEAHERLHVTPPSEVPRSLTAAIAAMDSLGTVPLEVLTALRALDNLRPSPTRDALGDRVALDSAEQRAHDAVSQYLREEMPNDPFVLAPVCADPLGETLEHFRTRAEEHYEARRVHLARKASELGLQITALRKTSELVNHVNWLIRYQIGKESGKESFQQIAESPPFATVDSVRVAIHRLAKLLGLRLRPSRRGRPPATD